ncbi:glycosyltransferase [Halalkalibacter alkalisediminis]|uniref:Glycosyltransferase n=1 Tax=Halalkalibacter alkalisediminis TaxID=935616 RepID=A0ABV6NI25_9BACI|nr:glycosyltransferase [Halalkalibacter alkalisediminis]
MKLKIGSITNPKILFFTPYYEQNRGNATTAKRIVKGLTTWGASIRVFAYEEQSWDAEWESYFHEADIYHVIHLKRFAEWFKRYSHLEISKPYILTSGGTDVNEDLKDANAARLMNAVADQSCGITVFSEDGKEKIVRANPVLADRIYVIPQSVELPVGQVTSVEFSGDPVFLLPAGLRPIKDVFYLFDELKKMRVTWPSLSFNILGPVLDKKVHQEVVEREKENDWFHYYDAVPIDQMKSIYEKVDIVLNSSISEGQSAAVLEALSIGKIVFARNNSGNASVIKEGKTGFLFHTPAEFHQKVTELFHSKEKQAEIREKAKTYIDQHHSLDKEMMQFLEVYTHCLTKVYSS